MTTADPMAPAGTIACAPADTAADTALTPAGLRLLEAASTLFYRHGIRAVGVDLIAETAGTTKKTLYDRFGSKDQLVVRYLRRRAGVYREFLRAGLAGVDPAQRPVAVFDLLGRWLGEQDRGCAFVNAHAEVGGTGHPAVAEIRAEKRWMREQLTELVREAGIADPGRVGPELHLLYEGATVLATAAGDADAVARARAAAVRLAG